MGRFALYGKLPAIGDFIHRGLARSEVDRIDAWLAQGMLSLQSRSSTWLDAYLVSPVWQAVVPAARLCSGPVACVLMPSVDRVGRYFPLVLLRELSVSEPDAAALLVSELAEAAAHLPRALQEGLGPEALLEGIEAALPIAPGQNAVPHPEITRLVAAFRPLGDLSQWWSLPGPAAPSRCIRHRGDVDEGLFQSLFDEA